MNPCPSCHRIDRIRKVSAIHAAGTTIGRTQSETWGMAIANGGYLPGGAVTTGVTSSQTELARKLSPPPAPGGSLILRILGWALILPGAAVNLLALGGFLLGGIIPDSPSVTMMAVGAVLLSLGAILALRGSHTSPGKRMAYAQDWQAWNRSWYCDRCDVVF